MKNIVIDAATVYLGGTITDPNELTGLADKCIGLTKDTVNITIKPKIREMDFNGKFDRKVKDTEIITGWDVKAECSALELSDIVLKGALLEKSSTVTGYDKYIPSNTITYQDLVVVGKLKGNAKPIVAVIKNAYSTDGLELKTKDLDEAVVSMSFDGHYTLGSDVAPAEFYMPTASGVQTLSIDEI